uniref:ATP synthase F0 subunit 8 n=1 Tax=Succinea erythrophana TaxID=3003847 RepID=A0A9E9EP37_9EUPU|nr:ATP synthase F0 subunit 8 [Succinea erythrophana]WAO26025.1 ATP synthase F0 subunit 8 [Succinea erythrophana]
MPQLSPMSILLIYFFVTIVILMNIFLQSYFLNSKSWKF